MEGHCSQFLIRKPKYVRSNLKIPPAARTAPPHCPVTIAVAFAGNIIWSYGLICGQKVLTNVISMAVAFEGDIIYDAAGSVHHCQ